jgi:hypothetical protein
MRVGVPTVARRAHHGAVPSQSLSSTFCGGYEKRFAAVNQLVLEPVRAPPLVIPSEPSAGCSLSLGAPPFEHAARSRLRQFGAFSDRSADGFRRHPQRDAARQYLDGLFNHSERTSMQAMHGQHPGELVALAPP